MIDEKNEKENRKSINPLEVGGWRIHFQKVKKVSIAFINTVITS